MRRTVAKLAGAPARIGKPENHLNVRNSGIIELRPVREKPGAFIKADGVRLGVKDHVRHRTFLRLGDERIEQRTADALPATIGRHCHAADLHAAIAPHEIAPGTDGLAVDQR